MSKRVGVILLNLVIIIVGLAICGILVYCGILAHNIGKAAEEESKKPVKVIENYEVPKEYLESPFDYESELEGKVIEVRGTVTQVSEDYPLISKKLIINDNIICRVSSINDSRMDLEDARVVLRGTVVSEATTLELNECDVKVLSEPE